MKRKAKPQPPDAHTPNAWLYSTSSGTGREHLTARVEKLAWPHGCDQCGQLISPAALDGVRSFSVARGLKPTTLYLCGTCVRDLCAAGAIPLPESDD